MRCSRHKAHLLLKTVAIILLCHYTPAWAQWKQQTITLKPGWNAVFLEVDPIPNDCGSVFMGLPIESVWAWNRRFETVQFIENANELVPEDPEWLVYFGPNGPDSAASTLFAVHSRPLLIKMAGSESRDWTVTGKPEIEGIDWVSNSFNLVGFHLDQSNPPKFSSFLSQDPALIGQPVYRLGENGRWEKIESLDTEEVRKGWSYWIFCDGSSSFSGGLSVLPDTGDGLRYGRSLVEQTLTLQNHSRAVQTVAIAGRPSAAAPAGEQSVAGDINLRYWEFSEGGAWRPLGDSYSIDVPAGGESRLRLEVQRPPSSGVYQSLVNVTNGAGISFDVPVSVIGIGDTTSKGSGTHPRTGLWVGTVVVNAVNFVNSENFDDQETPISTASEFQFRILVHVDAQGTPRLLQEVIQMWRPGTMNSDGTVATPGEFVLLTDDSRLSEFDGATLRDGTPAGRRFSTAAFGFHDPIPMDGTFSTPESPTTTIECDVVLHFDDPLNPFYHRYHPDHDNLNFDFEPYEGNPQQESWDVTRSLKLTFTNEDPERLAIAGWGDTQIGGNYRESFRGLHKDTLEVSGIFRLQHASRTSSLDP